MKRPSFPMSDARLANLQNVANSVGCKSWRVMLRRIADGEICVDKAPKNTMSGLGGFIPVVDHSPIKLETKPPAWNAPMCQKSKFVTDRGDGTFVDTEEFDKPVPRKQIPAEILPGSGMYMQVPSVSSNVEAMKNATKEQKIQAALAAMGSAIKKGSEL